MVPIFLIIALGLLTLTSTLFEEIRKALFSKVQIQLVRQIGLQEFQHLHQLSHDFHQAQQTARMSHEDNQ